MNFIQTLYLNPSKDPFKHSFGWTAPEYHLMGWALSCLQLNKIYKRVELYANSTAAKLLIDILQLPYHKVNVTHDNLTFADENLWALPKILTYSLQNNAFIHFDGDVFLFNNLPDNLLKNELIAQNIEEGTDFYISTQKEMLKHFTYFPDCVKAEFDAPIPIKAVNAGVLGANNIAFIKEYASLAFEYINRNNIRLPLININRFNVFFEQHLFYCLAKEKNISIGVFLADTIKDNEYKHLSEFHEVPCIKDYLHLLGPFKKDKYTCVQMAAKLRDLYPEYYYRVLSICKRKNLPLSINFCLQEKVESVNDFLNYNKGAKESYDKGIHEMDSNGNDYGSILNNTQILDLSILESYIKNYTQDAESSLSRSSLEKDFKTFSKSLNNFLNNSKRFSPYYLYGRDLKAINWYCQLFAQDAALLEKILCKCDEIVIIESEFDWAGLMNKSKRIGVKYYEDLELSSGHFFNLVIAEVSVDRCSLFDLDELEKLILNHLSIPLSINALLEGMQCYVEDNVIQYHLDTYNNLIITLLKQLVIKKAIKPFN